MVVRRDARVVALAIAALALACAGRSSETPVLACAPPNAVPGGSPGVAAGDYTLTLVATTGDSAGRSVAGHLQLMAPADSLRMWQGRATPLVGISHIGLDAVAAITLGDLASTDPAAPGAIVFAQGDGPATIRFGSLANRRDITRFDGGYMALTATEARQDGFAGTWASGVTGPEAGGHFCAVRRIGG